MPHRVMNVLWVVLGVLGVFVVGALILLRLDPHRAARRGPRWRRALLSAGLLLLAAAGMNLRPVQSADAEPAPAKTQPPKDLPAGRQRWQAFEARWREVEVYATGRRGRVALDGAGKKRLLAEIDALKEQLDVLAKQGDLTVLERELLSCELSAFTNQIRPIVPRERRFVGVEWEASWKKTLAPWRAAEPLLAALAGQERINPLVAREAERMLVDLRAELYWCPEYAPPAGVKASEAERRRVTALLAKLRRVSTDPSPAGRSTAWQQIVGALEADRKANAAREDESFFGMKEGPKQALCRQLSSARKQLPALRKAKLLTEPEAELIEKVLDVRLGHYADEDWLGPTTAPAEKWVDPALVEAMKRVRESLDRLKPLMAGPMPAPVKAIALAALMRDVAFLDAGGRPGSMGLYRDDDHAEAMDLLREAEEFGDKLADARATRGQDLVKEHIWDRFVAHWQAADRLLAQEELPEIDRADVLHRLLSGQVKKLGGLSDRELLSKAELVVLQAGTAQLLKDLKAFEPEQYVAAALSLRPRAPLLAKIGRDKTIHPRAILLVLSRVVGDLEDLHLWFGEFNASIGDRSRRFFENTEPQALFDEPKPGKPKKEAPDAEDEDDDLWSPKPTGGEKQAKAIGAATLAAVKKILPRLAGDGEDLLASPLWQYLTGTWRDLEALASLRRGVYPSNEFGLDQIRGSAVLAREAARVLSRAGLLTQAEADLLESELAMLGNGAPMATWESYGATCYEVGGHVFPSGDGLARLAGRAALLKKAAAAKRLRPEVLARVLYTVELDLDEGVPAFREQDEQDDKKAAQDARDIRTLQYREVLRVRAALAEIRRRNAARPTDLAPNPDWRAVTQAWALAGKLAMHNGKTADRRRADALLDAAMLAQSRLRMQGLISHAEARLLRQEATCLRMHVYRRPPTDHAGGVYEDPSEYGWRDEYWRHAERQPWQDRLRGLDEIRPAVLRLAIPAIQADSQLLGDSAYLDTLTYSQCETVTVARRQAQAALGVIQALVKDSEKEATK